MNALLTKKAKHIVLFTVLAVFFAMLSMPVFGFSETYSAENKITDEIKNTDPVNITLIKNGVEYDYTYFPVECSEFLLFAGVTLTEIDSVNVSADTVLYDKMMIDVATVEYETVVLEEIEECEYDLTEVDTVPKGEKKVTVPGVNGVKKVTYLSKKVDGVVTEMEVIGEEIISRPVKGKAEIGVGGTVTAKDGTVYRYSYKKKMEATAYTYVPGKTTMTTATGETLRKGIVAVDPKVIPMHTKMYIASDTFEYGYGVAEDTGGVIKGDIVDLAFMSYDECIQFGRRKMWVYILEE